MGFKAVIVVICGEVDTWRTADALEMERMVGGFPLHVAYEEVVRVSVPTPL